MLEIDVQGHKLSQNQNGRSVSKFQSSVAAQPICNPDLRPTRFRKSELAQDSGMGPESSRVSTWEMARSLVCSTSPLAPCILCLHTASVVSLEDILIQWLANMRPILMCQIANPIATYRNRNGE